jgi:hypothetical protein
MRRQAEEGGEGFWNPEQLDRDRASRWGTGIASQSLLPREAVVSSLRTGKRQWRIHQEGGESSSHQYLQMLLAQKLHTHSSMLSPAPVTPEEGGRADDERVEQHAHLARLGGGTAIPLALPAHRTRTATADTVAPYTTRRLPAASLRRSWTTSDWPAGQRNVPSGCGRKSCPEKRPTFQGRATSTGPYPCGGEDEPGA